MKMETKKINILGSEYTLKVCSDAEEPRLDGYDGFCDETTKELFAESYSKDIDSLTCKGKLQIQINKVKRHEIIHAFLFESGLAENQAAPIWHCAGYPISEGLGRITQHIEQQNRANAAAQPP